MVKQPQKMQHIKPKLDLEEENVSISVGHIFIKQSESF